MMLMSDARFVAQSKVLRANMNEIIQVMTVLVLDRFRLLVYSAKATMGEKYARTRGGRCISERRSQTHL